jgi:predicted transcriptional regulator
MMHHMAPGDQAKIKRLSVGLDPDDRDFLEKLASERDRSLSWMASHAIRFYLAEMRKGSALALRFEAPEP